jgi:phosphoribosylformimino-5-aminoimidazole carboxamide ribotide isomerase
MIKILPSIDVIDGRCVRLSRGDFSRVTEYEGDPVSLAKDYAGLGFKDLHLVDLDGARQGKVVNLGILEGIVKRTGMKVDFGGGIKSEGDLESVFRAGAAMVNLGSIAVTGRSLVKDWLERYGARRFILSADTRRGKVAYNAWQEDSGMDLVAFIKSYSDLGITRVACTDIDRDGLLKGPSVDLYRELAIRFPDLNLIASGGVSGLEDIKRLEEAGAGAVIIGKALYENPGFAGELAKYYL